LLFIVSSVGSIGLETKENDNPSIEPVNSPTDHIWPQQGYNASHIGRSPYSTESNPGIEKWRFPAGDCCDGSPSIGPDGCIYFGCADSYLYAVYPNGSLKWKFKAERMLGDFGDHSAIAEDGSVYFATKFGSYIQAVNPDGTDKWHYWVPEIDTSITIHDDVIYYGHRGDGVDARYTNGTLKWRYETEGCVQSTPAVDNNGIIYFGAHDYYIRALYPNGTLKWEYMTNGWVHGSPSIAPDGTIYCGSDDYHLYAFYPNGSLKWDTTIGSGMRCSPSLDKDGNLYFGTDGDKLFSVDPNGNIRWEFVIGDDSDVWGSTAAVSDDGSVYFGSNIDHDMLGGGEIIALDLDGNLLWRKYLCDSVCRSSPVIGEDGSVYICGSNDGTGEAWGYLHAFGSVESNNPPTTPIIDGPTEGQVGEYYYYYMKSDDLDNNPISYFVDWGDGDSFGWTHDYEPGLNMRYGHTYEEQGNFTIKAKTRDTFGLESDWGYLEVTMPVNQQSYSFPLLQRFLERFPNMFPILRYPIGL